MDFSNEEKDNIKKLIRKSSTNPLLELECIIGNINKDINTKDHFVDVLKRLKRKFTKMTSNNVLLIYFPKENNKYMAITKHIDRVVINGNGLISHYAKTNKLNAILEQTIFETKTYDNISKDRIIDENYNIRFNLKKEQDIDCNSNNIVNLVKEWSKLGKFFRKKQTFTFYEEENDFQIDVSIISSNPKNIPVANTLNESKVLENKNITYEIEIEYIGNKKPGIKEKFEGTYHKNNNIDRIQKEKEQKDNTDYQDNILSKYITIIRTILQAKFKTLFIVRYDEKIKVHSAFQKLIKNPINTYFPFVVDLEHPNLMQLPILNYFTNDNDYNIRMDYAVTDKTDGIRYILYINSNGKCYLKGRDSTNGEINSYIYTGTIIKEYANSIFDGELIDKTLDGKFIQNFYVFDAYIVKGENITKNIFGTNSKPSNRYYHVCQLEKHFEKSDDIMQEETIPSIYMLKIFKKVYYYGNTSDTVKEKLKDINLNDKKILAKIEGKYDTKIFDSVEKILKKCNVEYGGMLEDGHMFSYKLDGLIFQPVNLGVNQNHIGEDVNKIGGTWRSAFRWKPAKELTIDFMVKFNRNSTNPKEYQEFYYKNNKYIQGTLFCKMWKTNIHKNMMAFKLINTGDNFNKYDEDMPFSPLHPYGGQLLDDKLYDKTSQIYILVDNKGQMRCSNGDIINDGVTIECEYDFKRDDEYRWVPKKVRPNKLPNALMTASGTWRMINNPIKSSMILGKEPINNTDYYYNKQQSTETKAMRDFNNFVKDDIIRRGMSGKSKKSKKKSKKEKIKTNSNTTDDSDVGSDVDVDSDVDSDTEFKKDDFSLDSSTLGEKSVLDLACGRFGDFFKYCKHGATKLVGMDISSDNIFNVEQGAAVRVLKSINQNQFCKPLVSNTMMLVGDCSKNLANGDATNDDLNKYYIDVLYGRIKPKYGKLSRMSGVGLNGFNLVVCNFAIHYMMNDYDSLHSFLENVKESLVSGGYFIGSCLDGELIVDSLKDDTKIEGYFKSSSSKSNKKDSSNKLIWRIEKVNKSEKLFEEDFVGQKVKVYMDTFFDAFEENLVNMKFLVGEAENYGLQLVDSKLFIDKQDNLFNDYKKDKPEYHKKIEANASIKEWLSFHRWFIFQKI